MKNKLLLLLFVLTSCGFSSGLYKDILLAQEYLEKQKFERAAEVYESILIKKPSLNIQIKVNDQLGEIYSVYLSDYPKSIKHFNNIVENSNEPSWQVRSLEKIGNIYFENLRDFTKAKEIYHKLVNFIPALSNQELYRFRYGLSYFYENDYDDAIKVLRKIAGSSQSDSSIQSYYYIGLSYFYKKSWEQANEFWFEYLKRESRKDRIIKTKFLIANAYESSEKLKEAYNIYYSILGEYPNPDVIQNRLNSLYKRRVSRKR